MDGKNETGTFELAVRLHYNDGSSERFHAKFNPGVTNQWQYAAVPALPKDANKIIETADVIASYNRNGNTVYFDGISLIEEIAQVYTYDEKGNVVAVNQTKTDQTSYSYSGANLISMTEADVGQTTFTYDSNNNVTAASNNGINMTYTYDSKGDMLTSRLQGSGSAYLQSSATYTADKDKVATATDANGVTTSYAYQASGDQQKTLLDTLTYDSFAGGNAQNVQYRYTYDNLGNITNTETGYQSPGASGYTYDEANKTRYLYDDLNQLVMESRYDEDQSYRYYYDSYGNIREKQTYDSATYTYPDQPGFYDTPIRVDTYSYNEANWLDLLTAYNGSPITYDQIGNPLQYYNGLQLPPVSPVYDPDGHAAANLIGGIVGGVIGASFGYLLAKQFG